MAAKLPGQERQKEKKGSPVFVPVCISQMPNNSYRRTVHLRKCQLNELGYVQFIK